MAQATPVDADSAPAIGADTPSARLPRVVVAAGFAILALSYMVNAMDRQVFFPILPQIRSEFGFSLPEGGMLATSFTLGMAIAGLPAGFVLSRLRRKTVLLASIVLYSVGTLATPLAAGFGSMMTYRIISGFGEGMQTAALFAAVGTYFFHRRGLAIGGIGLAFGMGIFLGPLVGVQFADSFGSWRAPFVLFGSCGLVMAMIALFALSRGMTERVDDPVVSTASYDHVPASAFNRNTLSLGASAALGGIAVYGFLGLYPTYLTGVLHYTTGQAAMAASFVGFGGLTALLAGWLGDRFDQRNLLVGTYVLLAATSVLVYQTHVTPGWQCLYAFLMGAFGTGSLYPNTSSAMQRAVRPPKVSSATGLFITCFYASSAFSGLIFASLVDAAGWAQAGLWQVTIASLLAGAVLFLVRSSQFITAARAR